MQSDDTVSMTMLKKDVATFIEARNWDQFHTPKDLAIGLITEASELLEHFRFRDNAEIDTLLTDDDFCQAVYHELADCLYFVLAISNKLQIDLTQVFKEKLAISAERYPVSLAAGRNVKYTQL